MRLITAVLLAGAGIAAAQSSSAPAAVASGQPSGCGSATDAIIQACLGSTSPAVQKCDPQNYRCQCTAQQAVVTCYNNCPSDPDAFGAKQKLTVFCNAAKTEPSSSVAPNGKGNAKATPATPSSSSPPTGAQTGFANGNSPSGSAAANSAAGINPASGLLAAVFGLALL